MTTRFAKLLEMLLIKLIKKKIEENLRRWHEVLSEALWAHRISRHGANNFLKNQLRLLISLILVLH